MSTKSGAHLRAPSATRGQGKPPSTHGGAGTAAGSPEMHIPGGQKVPKQREGKKPPLGVEGKHILKNTYPNPKCVAEGSDSPQLGTAALCLWDSQILSAANPTQQRDCGSALRSVALHGSAWVGSAKPSLAWLNRVGHGSAWVGSAKPGLAWHRMAQPSLALQSLARHGSAQLGTAKPGSSRLSPARVMHLH